MTKIITFFSTCFILTLLAACNLEEEKVVSPRTQDYQEYLESLAKNSSLFIKQQKECLSNDDIIYLFRLVEAKEVSKLKDVSSDYPLSQWANLYQKPCTPNFFWSSSRDADFSWLVEIELENFLAQSCFQKPIHTLRLCLETLHFFHPQREEASLVSLPKNRNLVLYPELYPSPERITGPAPSVDKEDHSAHYKELFSLYAEEAAPLIQRLCAARQQGQEFCHTASPSPCLNDSSPASELSIGKLIAQSPSHDPLKCLRLTVLIEEEYYFCSKRTLVALPDFQTSEIQTFCLFDPEYCTEEAVSSLSLNSCQVANGATLCSTFKSHYGERQFFDEFQEACTL
jgi:hypothetical protein